MNHKNLLIACALAASVAGCFLFFSSRVSRVTAPAHVTSTPEGSNGGIFPDAHANLIRVTSPTPRALVASPLEIKGEARGMWYFEASFPIVLLDMKGNQLAQGHAEARGDWMTEQFVPFTAHLQFDPLDAEEGILVLKKDNPSGDPIRDDEIRIPVRFK